MRFPRSRRWLPGLKGRCLEPTAVFQIKYEYVPSPGNHNLSWLATMGFYRRADVKIWRGPSDLRFSQATRPSQEKSSLLASARGSSFTYNVDQGGFSEDNLLSIDQRGFKRLIQAEAVSGCYRMTMFRSIHPLPQWKVEAIHSLTMATYTKIFIQFPQKFWFDTEVALYADSERGRYPLWMSLDLDGFMPGSGVIFATVTGDYPKRIDATTDAQVQTEFSDPLYRGSYSTWLASFIPQHLINLGASLGRLWFAGEGSSEGYFGAGLAAGSLYGAYFDGEAAASQIVQCIKGQRCYHPLVWPDATESESPLLVRVGTAVVAFGTYLRKKISDVGGVADIMSGPASMQVTSTNAPAETASAVSSQRE
ncbi:hypothetical protein EDB84DRAFT_1437201 [Lactarius hengduanensis]|nr:hypothetical protein EDB84DRAFT_1437201 [Lactarius hengduanensis]